RAEDPLPSDVEHLGAVVREHDREGPAEAVLQVLGLDSLKSLRPHADLGQLLRLLVEAQEGAGISVTPAALVDVARIRRVYRMPARLGGARVLTVPLLHRPLPRPGGDAAA